jgi:hypothetical protein
MPTEGPLMPDAARRQPDQTELEDLRASAALWGQGVGRMYSAFGLPNNEMMQPIIAAIRFRWSMPGNA